MQFDFTLIGIALATMFFGYFFGLFEGRGQGYKRRKKEEAEEKIHATPAAPVAAIKVDDPGLLRLKDDSGQMLLDLDGARVNTAALTPSQKKRLIGLLTLMRPWLEREAPSPQQTAPASVNQPTPLEARQGSPASKLQPALSPTPPATAMAAQSELEEEKPAAPLSIVAQIDSVLQMRLMNTPLARRGIRLQESPEGGVLVWVGIHKFTKVEDVPEDEIKTAIRAAITEWEDKYTPG
jgi:hypothetical protein